MLRKLKVSYGRARSQTMAEDTDPAFETAIEHELTSRAGYAQRGPTECAERQALFPADVLGFLRQSESGKWDALEKILANKPNPQCWIASSRSWRSRERFTSCAMDSSARQGPAHGLVPAQRHHGSGGRRELRQEPVDHHAPSRLHFSHAEARRQASSLHHRCDPCRQRAPRRHRRTQEPANPIACGRCGDAPRLRPRRSGAQAAEPEG